MSRAIRTQRTAKPVLEFADVERLCSRRYEREARQRGWLRIAGLDEAGRGSLFGPVVAAAVILSPTRRIVGLDDSKKINPERRFILAERIRLHALAWAVAEIDASRIDAWNIYQASRQAMVAAISQLQPLPDYLLLDALELDLPIEQKALIHGDMRSASIAAASILAKVERDRRMAGVRPALSSIWSRAAQGLQHPGALGRPSPARAHSLASVLIRASERGPMLVHGRHSESAPARGAADRLRARVLAVP